MNIASICRRRVVTVDAGSPLTQAARLMREHHVGSLVVTSDEGDGPRVKGVLTDRDLVIEALASEMNSASVKVGELAHTQVVGITEDDEMRDAVTLMRDQGVRRVLVVDEDRQLTGVVSLDDLIEASVELIAGVGEVMRRGIERETAGTKPPPVTPPLRIPAATGPGERTH